jgi:hypothetical protein
LQEQELLPAPVFCSCLLLLDCLLLLHFIDRPSLLLPQLKAAQQSCCVSNTFCFECDHRTGGRMFFGSRTIGNDHLVVGKLVNVIQDLARGNESRAWNVSHIP